MAYDAVAFCPGHITGFFEVCPDEDPYKMGSRGAGICLSHGVHTGVRVADSDELRINTNLNGRAAEAPVTKKAILNLPMDKTLIEVFSRMELPVSQGFGMSGAGALSAAMAVNEALGLGLPEHKVVRAAHKAEVECMTGLGDVYPQSVGGLVVRTEPGVEPHGRIQRFTRQGDIVLCVVGPPLPTKEVLEDGAVVGRITKLGRLAMNNFLNEPSIGSFLHNSLEFAEETELISEEVRNAIEACKEFGGASMSMLGNSVFAIGDTDNLRYQLLDFGETFIVSIENEGARLVSTTREE